MRRDTSLLIIVAMACVLVGCQPAPDATPMPSPTAPLRPTNTPPPTATPIATPTTSADAGAAGKALPTDSSRLFAASGVCAGCHTGMDDEAGANVSLDREWRASIMANAGRDPFWLASLRGEVEAHDDMRTSIEETCATCHMPMGAWLAAAGGDRPAVLGEGMASPDDPLHVWGADGVSCSLCHQILDVNLGLPAANSGGYRIDVEQPAGSRPIFGPFNVDPGQAAIMQGGSGFTPVQGTHLSRSEVCATCHVLYSPTRDVAGDAAGEFPQQVPYYEWFYSSYRTTRSCQDCHMPEAEGGVRIALSSKDLRSPFLRHSFSGANAFMQQLLKQNGDDLGVTVSAAHFDAALAGTLEMLQEETASLSIDETRLVGSYLTATIVVENKAGHKFPTGFPSRRAWLHLLVTDSAGKTVFESGAVNPDGSIVGNANDEDPLAVEPHYEAIVQPEQVQVYEAVIEDREGKLTTGLMNADSYRKDNRLLPLGFEKGAPYEDIAVRGEARDDVTFLDTGDRLDLAVRLEGAQAPLTLKAELLYQTIGFRWAENLRGVDGDEVQRFLDMYDAASKSPVVIATASQEIRP
jgi:mono/diheme cytochrome c family protein